MQEIAAQPPVRRALQVLFGASSKWSASAGFAVVSESDLKAAWRQRIFESHPDRARTLGRSEADLAAECTAINEAFALLKSVREAPHGEAMSSASTPAQRPSRTRAQTATCDDISWQNPAVSELFWRTSTPARALRLSEYLYYTGHISYQALIASLSWQRSVRPRFGEVARDRGRLSREEVHVVVTAQRSTPQTMFGAVAVRRGLLTERDTTLITTWQRLAGPSIGAYFLDFGLLDRRSLTVAMAEQRQHNGRFAAT